MSSKKKKTIKSFEMTYLFSVPMDMGDKIDKQQFEKFMSDKEKTVVHKKEHVKLVLAEDGIVANRPIWWPGEKLNQLPYKELMGWYTFEGEQKRFSLDVACNVRKQRRILLFKIKNPLELVILSETLQNRNMFSRVYEADNLTKVEYGSWVSTYTRDKSLIQDSFARYGLGRTPVVDDMEEEYYDPNYDMYPERDYPDQFQDDRGLTVRNTCHIDYNDTEHGAQFIRNDVSLMLPSYTERSKMLRRPDLYPAQWGKTPLVPNTELCTTAIGAGLAESLARDSEYFLTKPGYNMVGSCVTMLKHYVQPRSGWKQSRHPPLSVCTSQRSIWETLYDSESNRCVIHVKPPQSEENDMLDGQIILKSSEDVPTRFRTNGWIYYKAEPMKLATVDNQGSRYMFVDTKA